jgi:hypothetical protein
MPSSSGWKNQQTNPARPNRANHRIRKQEPAMSQPTLNATPLFQTTLRQWQAEWKARRAGSEGDAAARRLLGLPTNPRAGRRTPRARQSSPTNSAR